MLFRSSFILRHQESTPLDAEGWVDIKVALSELKQKTKLKEITVGTIEEIMEQSEKKRFEIANGRIRAKYGHSREDKIQHTPTAPPLELYHGTWTKTVATIVKEGLKPMDRQYVHLSHEKGTATEVGRRHGKNVAILVLDAQKAWADGLKFYLSNDTWLADDIPPEYIKEIEYAN